MASLHVNSPSDAHKYTDLNYLTNFHYTHGRTHTHGHMDTWTHKGKIVSNEVGSGPVTSNNG